MKLIDNWKKSWKLWSIQLNILSIIIITILTDLPSHIIASWALLPEEFKSQLDKDIVAGISIGLIILNILARLVSQTRERVLEELKEDEEKKDEEV